MNFSIGYVLYLVFLVILYLILFIMLFKGNLNNYNKIMNKYKYYRDIPGDYGPEILGYLLTSGYIKKEYLSASILELIRRKIFVIEEKSDGSYCISDNDINNLFSLSESEKYLKKWLINDIGNGISFNTDELYISYFDEHNKIKFEHNFKEWSKIVIEMGKKEGFYSTGYKEKSIWVFFLIGLSVSIKVMLFYNSRLVFLGDILIFLNLIVCVCLFRFAFKTSKGKEEYAKWIGFKNFVSEFSDMKNKDILNVKLWDKFYVYAVVFGITDKLDNTLLISDDYSIYDEAFLRKNILGLKRELLIFNRETSEKKTLIQKILYFFDKNKI